MAGRYRALLVDYGGVLTTSMSVGFAAFCVANGVDPRRLTEVLAAAYVTAGQVEVPANDLHDLVTAVETGRIDPTEFDRRLAVALSDGLPAPIEPEGLTGRLLSQLGPDEAMRAAVIEAKRGGLRVGLISNTWGVTPPSDVEGMFDAVVLSGREGVRKPEAAIYLLAADRLRVEPNRCVFVDDMPANVDGAKAVGMAGVLHRDAAITIPKLEALLGVPLRP